MLKLKNDYAIQADERNFTLIKFGTKINKEGEEVENNKVISYHASLEQALQNYLTCCLSTKVKEEDVEIKEIKSLIEEIRDEIKGYI